MRPGVPRPRLVILVWRPTTASCPNVEALNHQGGRVPTWSPHRSTARNPPRPCQPLSDWPYPQRLGCRPEMVPISARRHRIDDLLRLCCWCDRRTRPLAANPPAAACVLLEARGEGPGPVATICCSGARCGWATRVAVPLGESGPINDRGAQRRSRPPPPVHLLVERWGRRVDKFRRLPDENSPLGGRAREHCHPASHLGR